MKKNHLPAGVGEKMQYLVHEHNDNTIRFIVFYPAGVDAARMARAACALANSVDVLHASFCAGSMDARWEIHDDVTQEDCFTLMQAEDVHSAAIACALKPIALTSRAQLHCSLVQGREQCAVVMCISHLCVDGSDGKYLLCKLAQAYNTPDDLAVKNGDRSATQVYAGLSKAEMRQLMRSPLGGVKTVFPFDSQDTGENRMTVHTIPAEVMGSARRRARTMNATANDLLLAAGYRALSKTPGLDDGRSLSIMSMMDLRRHCPGGDSAGLSNLVGSLGTSLPQGAEGDFAQVLQQVARQTRAAKEDPLAGLTGMPLLHGAIKAVPLSMLRRVVDRVYGSFSVGLTNLGVIPDEALRLGALLPVGGCFGGPLKKKPAMQISAASFAGACSLCVVGQYTARDACQVQQLMERMEAELAEFSAAP